MRFAKGLAARLFLTHLGLALLIIVAGGTYLTISLQRTYPHSLEASLQDHAHLLAEAVRPSLESGDYEHLRLTLDALNDRVEASAIVEDGQGVVVGSTDPELASLIGQTTTFQSLQTVLRLGRPAVRYQDEDDLVFVAVAIRSNDEPIGAIRIGHSVIGSPAIGLQGERYSIVQTLGIGIIAAAALSALVALGLAHRLSRPARSLATAAAAFAQGDYSRRASVAGPSEIREAAEAFNDMANQVQQLLHAREAFLSQVSHEVHSTITGMNMAVEVLQRNQQLDAAAERLLLNGLRTHTQRLRRLADDLLQAARLAQGTLSLRLGPVDPADLVSEVASIFLAEAAERGLELAHRATPELPPISADADRLSQSLGNLVENALRLSPTGSSVQLRAEQEGDWCVLTVEDEGPGLSPADIEQLLGAAQPNPMSYSGRLGLGLPIARAIAAAHNGRLEAFPRPSHGSVFRLLIPIDPG